jgi:DNA-binding transcriptional ArsR family regulator
MQAATRNTPIPIEVAMTAVANPRRRQILQLVWDGERSAGEIAATLDEVSWPAVSQSLRRLKDSGLITERRAGTHRYYKADRRALAPFEGVLRQMWTRELGRLRDLAEAEARSRRKRRD